MRHAGAGFVLAFIIIMPAIGLAQTNEPPRLMAGPSNQISLVKGLKEISGLAAASDDSVYAHNDEHGIVYEVSIEDGKVSAAFALGDPTVKADFEGIAAVGDRVYLLTSTGLIYEARIGGHRQRVKFNVFDTGAGDFCEAEGLALTSSSDEFLILCKKAHTSSLSDRLIVFRWGLSERLPVKSPWINIPFSNFLAQNQTKEFRPSAIEWDATNQLTIILSARDNRLVAVDQNRRVAYTHVLSSEAHLQAEGVALMRSGDLVIADEGAGRGPGKLSIYKAQR